MVRNLVVLGCTGSIGRQTLDIVRRHPDRIKVVGLAAGSNVGLLRAQAQLYRPDVVVSQAALPAEEFPYAEVLRGIPGMVDLVTRDSVDLIVVGTSGSAGLLPSIEALRADKLVALANKEALVMAGPFIQRELSRGQGRLVPIDSEHSAIWQCLLGEPHRSVEKLTLTASGGALRSLPMSELARVTPQQALKHPTWNMGAKITIDSANLMNKGLEILEAHLLFDLEIDMIDVVLHPQSIVHSLVTFDDSSTKAQMGVPDMRLPIQYALSHPDRWSNDLPRLDLAGAGTLEFAEIDRHRYPALQIAREVGRHGGTYPAVLTASDESAVSAFLAERVAFTDIPAIVQRVLDAHESCSTPELQDIIDADRWARDNVERLLN